MTSSIPQKVWKNITTILVDFDGTIADSHPRLFQAYQKFMKLNGREGTHPDFKELIAFTLTEIVQKIIDKHQLKTPHAALLLSYEKILEQVFEHEIEMVPGALETLTFIKNQNIPMAVVSAADRSLVEPFLIRHKIHDYFKAIAAAEGATIPGKPAPDLYILALKLMGINPTQAIAIEDSEGGVASAIGAGIFTVFLKNPTHEKLKKEYHNIVEANGWSEVLQILQERPFGRDH